MLRPRHRRALGAAVALSGLALGACRESTDSGASPSVSFPPSSVGASGCNAADQVFAPPQAPQPVALATATLGPLSQVCAARGGELLYLTGAGATVWEVTIDPLTGLVTDETELVGPGDVAALYGLLGIVGAPLLSGLCVLDTTRLVVMEHTANVLLAVDRITPGVVTVYAGEPNVEPGFADLPVPRFAFGAAPSMVLADGSTPPQLIVADTGNERVRFVAGGIASTLVGTGSASSIDGDLGFATVDAPSGITLTCGNRVIVTERGDGGAGERVRELVFGESNFFDVAGISQTLAGGGALDEGPGEDVALATPVAPYATNDGQVYWIDAASGVLRRQALDGTVDCPLAVDCATALGAPSFAPGASFSMCSTDSGVLYVLQASGGAQTLFRVTP